MLIKETRRHFTAISILFAEILFATFFSNDQFILLSSTFQYVSNFINITQRKKFMFFPESHIKRIKLLHFNRPFIPTDRMDFDIKDVKRDYPVPFLFYDMKYYLAVFNNIYYSTSPAFIVNGTDYVHDVYQHKKHYKVVKEIPSAVSLCSNFARCYGDFILGQLISLAALPKEVMGLGTFIINSRPFRRFYKEIWDLNGNRPKETFFLDTTKAVFVGKLYTVLPVSNITAGKASLAYGHSFYGSLAARFGDRMRELFGCDRVEPSDYIFYNRNKNGSRSFMNFEEILAALQAKYPEYGIKPLVGSLPSLKKTVIAHARIKWYLGFAGSNCMNFLFMKEGVSVCIAMTMTKYDRPVMATCFSKKLKVLTFQTKSNLTGKSTSIDVDRVVHYAGISLTNEKPTY